MLTDMISTRFVPIKRHIAFNPYYGLNLVLLLTLQACSDDNNLEVPLNVLTRIQTGSTMLPDGTAAADTTDFSEASKAIIYHSAGGDDVVTGSRNGDVLRGGIGSDMLKGGEGNDEFLIITPRPAWAQYHTDNSFSFAVNTVSPVKLNTNTANDVDAGDRIDGGTGTNDTVTVFGTAEITFGTAPTPNIVNVEQIAVLGDVTFTDVQNFPSTLALRASDGSFLRFEGSGMVSLADVTASGTPALPGVTISGTPALIEITSGVTLSGTAAQFAALQSRFVGAGTLQLTESIEASATTLNEIVLADSLSLNHSETNVVLVAGQSFGGARILAARDIPSQGTLGSDPAGGIRITHEITEGEIELNGSNGDDRITLTDNVADTIPADSEADAHVTTIEFGGADGYDLLSFSGNLENFVNFYRTPPADFVSSNNIRISDGGSNIAIRIEGNTSASLTILATSEQNGVLIDIDGDDTTDGEIFIANLGWTSVRQETVGNDTLFYGDNRAPIVENNKNIVATLNEQAAPFNIDPPLDPEGEELVITITRIPIIGNVSIDGTIVQNIGGTFAVNEFQNITYHASGMRGAGANLGTSDNILKLALEQADYDGFGYVGNFEYSVSDGNTTVNVLVGIHVNTPPTARDGQINVNTGVARPFSPTDFGFSDADGDIFVNLTITAIEDSNGRFTFNGNALAQDQLVNFAEIASLIYTGTAAGDDNDSLSFTVSDIHGGTSAVQTLTFVTGTAASAARVFDDIDVAPFDSPINDDFASLPIDIF